LSCLAAAVDFALDETRIFQKPDDLAPYELIKIIVSDWPIRAKRPIVLRQAKRFSGEIARWDLA